MSGSTSPTMFNTPLVGTAAPPGRASAAETESLTGFAVPPGGEGISGLTPSATSGTGGFGLTGNPGDPTVSSFSVTAPDGTVTTYYLPPGAGMAGGPAGNAGAAAITISNDLLSEESGDGGSITATATGGAGGEGTTGGQGGNSPGDSTGSQGGSPVVTVGAVGGAGGTGGAGGSGGSATVAVSGVTSAQGSTTDALTAIGGAGGAGGSGGNGGNGGPAGAGGAGGAGGNGGSAVVSLVNSLLDVGQDIAGQQTLGIGLLAQGAAGGMAGPGGSGGPAGGLGLAGNAGSATVDFENNTLEAKFVNLQLATVAGSNPDGGPGAAAITFANNTVAVFSINTVDPGLLYESNGSLAISLGETTAAGQPMPLSAAPGGNLVFSGNRFTGPPAVDEPNINDPSDNTQPFSLSLASGSYMVDTAAGTLSIDGSAPNSLTAFNAFNLAGVAAGDGRFVEGSGNASLSVSAAATTTVVVTPTSGNLQVNAPNASNLILDFQGFGSSLHTLAQYNADVSEQSVPLYGSGVSSQEQVVSLPGGGSIGLPVGAQPGVEFSQPDGAIAVGAGADTLALKVNEDYFLGGDPSGNAQFTLSVDGTQVGAVQVATAQAFQGQSQTFDVMGNFGPGAHTVAVDFLNDAYAGPGMDRNLYVTGGSYDGMALPGAQLALLAGGSQSFSFDTASGPPAPVTIGSGPDDLALQVSEDAFQGDAQYTISVDGQQQGGVQTATASHSAGQDQTVNVLGDFGSGQHTVTVDFLNDASAGPGFDRNLYVDGATINSQTIGQSRLALLTSGPESFIYGAPAAGPPAPLTVGSGPDDLALSVSEDAWQGNASFTLDVDGQQVGGVLSATAAHAAGQMQTLNVLGSYAAGTHTVSVDFLNDLYDGPGFDRNLYLGGASLNGTAVAGSALALLNNGTQSFSFITPLPAG